MRTHIAVAMASALAVACGQPATVCTPQNCSGCCDAMGACHTGLFGNACGENGDVCTVCKGGTHCSLGVCISGIGGGQATGGGAGAGGGLGGSGGFGGSGGGGFSSGGGSGGGFVPTNDAGFPAAHPPFPTEVNFGGPVLQTPRVMSITFANDDPAIVAAIDDFVATVGTIDYWHTTTAEYGVGPLTAAPPVHLAESPTGTIQDVDVDTWLQAHLTGPSPALGPADPNTVYMVFYPASVTIYSGGPSCVAFGGYHYMSSIDGGAIAYAVLPRCPGFIPGASDADSLTGAASHELVEAVTDPIPIIPAWGAVDEDHEAWNMVIFGEVGDLCTFDSDSFFTPAGYHHMVQRIWSNAAAADGGHPCVPRGDPYFGAVPVLPDEVPFDFVPYAVTGDTQGVHTPLGSSRTIDVDLFSEAPGQLILVSAYAYPTPGTASFSFSQGGWGYNGDVLKMTVDHVADDPMLGGATFLLTASSNSVTHYYFGFIGD